MENLVSGGSPPPVAVPFVGTRPPATPFPRPSKTLFLPSERLLEASRILFLPSERLLEASRILFLPSERFLELSRTLALPSKRLREALIVCIWLWRQSGKPFTRLSSHGSIHPYTHPALYPPSIHPCIHGCAQHRNSWALSPTCVLWGQTINVQPPFHEPRDAT